MNTPKFAETIEERNARVVSLLSAIHVAAISVFRKYPSQFGSLEIDDVESELVEFVMSRTSLNLEYKALHSVLMREVRQILFREDEQRGKHISFSDDGESPTISKAELKKLLEADWDTHPSFLKSALVHKYMKPEYRQSLQEYYLQGVRPEVQSAALKRYYRALDRLLAVCQQTQESDAVQARPDRPSKGHAHTDYYGSW